MNLPPDPSEDSPQQRAGSQEDLPYSQSELEELSRALRALARGLVLDDATADDLVQEAWLAALEQPRDRVRNMTAWLRTVMRNIASRNRRRRARRQETEEHASRSESVAGPDALAMQLSVLRLLQRSVAELPEPFRIVVQMRFFEELSAAEIAERLDRPMETVKTQLARGTQRLRSRLDGSFSGDRRAWVGLLGALNGASPQRALAQASDQAEVATSVPNPASRMVWSAVALTVVVLGARYLLQSNPETPTIDELSPAGASATELSRTADVDVPAERTALSGTGNKPEPEVSPPSAPTRRLEIVVVDGKGFPVPGALVTYSGGTGKVVIGKKRCDASGRALLELQDGDLLTREELFQGSATGIEVFATHEGHADSHDYRVALPEDAGELKRFEIPLRGPALVVAGQVVDSAGRPVSGAEVLISSPDTNWFDMEDGTLRIEPKKFQAANEHGEFRIEGLPSIDLQLLVLAPGHAALLDVIPGEGPNPRHLKLEMPTGGIVAGVLFNANGETVPDARVWTATGGIGERHPAETRTDEIGFFRLEGLDPGGHYLFATHPAYEGWVAHTVLQLTAGGSADWEAVLDHRPPLRIRLVDPDGAPLANHVFLVNLGAWEGEWGANGFTDVEGRGVVHPVPDGPLIVTVPGENFQESQEFALTAPDIYPSFDEVELRVGSAESRGTEINGTLLDVDESPIWHARLQLMSVDRSASFNTTTDVDGAFVLRGMAPGPYSLFAHFNGKGVAELARFEMSRGEPLDLGVLRLPPETRVPVDWAWSASPPQSVTIVSGAWMDDAHTAWYWKTILEDKPLPEPLVLLPCHHQIVIESPGVPRQERRIHLGSEPIQLSFGPDEVYPQRFRLLNASRHDAEAQVAVFEIPPESAGAIDALDLASHELVHDELVPLNGGEAEMRLTLPKGSYAIELYTDSGGPQRYLFELLNVPTTDSGIELSLAPD